MNTKQLRPGASRELRGARKTWGLNISSLTPLWKSVNHLRLRAVIQFRNVVVDGIALAGWPKCPWLSQLVDRLTVLADAIAEKSGVRA